MKSYHRKLGEKNIVILKEFRLINLIIKHYLSILRSKKHFSTQQQKISKSKNSIKFDIDNNKKCIVNLI